MITYLLFNAKICNQAEFKTLLNVIFGTIPAPPATHPQTSTAGAQQLKGPCFPVTLDVKDGGWKG